MLVNIKIKNDKSEFLRQVEPIYFKIEKDFLEGLLPKGIHYFREEGRENDERIRLYRIDNMYTDMLITIIDGKIEEKHGDTILKIMRVRNKMKISWQVMFFLIPFIFIFLIVDKGNHESLYGILGAGVLFCIGVEGYKIRAAIKAIQYLKSLNTFNTKKIVETLEYPVEVRRKVSNKNWQREFNTACSSIKAEELKERMSVWRINFFEKPTYWRKNIEGEKRDVIEFYRIDSHFITKSMICFRGVYEEKMGLLNLGIKGYKMKFPIIIFLFGIGVVAEFSSNWIWGIIYDGIFLSGYFIYRKIFLKRGIQETIQWIETFLK